MHTKYQILNILATTNLLFLLDRFLSSFRQESLEAEKQALEDKQQPKAVDKTKFPGGQISIYYATQTGTAESFAQQLEREAKDHGFVAHVKDLEDVELSQFVEGKDGDSGTSRVVLLAATYGEGEPTDNANVLYQTLKEKLINDDKEDNNESDSTFKGMDFCVFALGNKQYDHYNAMGVFFDEAFDKLGGNRIMKIGTGDDDNDLEGDFETWKDKFWTQLKRKYLKNGETFHAPVSKEKKLPVCDYVVEYHHDDDDDKSAKPAKISIDQVHGSCKPFFQSFDCPVSAVRELRSPDDVGSTVHVEIDISNAKGLDYHTADNLGVLAVNDADVVESVAKALGFDLDAVFSIKAAPNKEWHGAPFPMPCTIRECLSRYLDLTSAPRRSDLKLLAQYAVDPIDQKALTRLSSKEGKKEYKEKVMASFVGIADLLNLCPSLQIPLEHFIGFCKHQVPRFYTIASSSSKHPVTVHLTVAVTEDKKRDGSVFKGVCSTHLATLRPGKDTVRVFNRPSSFRLPQDSTRPIIMIGPGTGVAPMRALLQERRHQQVVEKKTIGPNVLYFGCKKSTLDYLYQDELKAFQDEGILSNLYVAFSREQKEKVYVQNLLSQNAKETWNLIDAESASIYVCGGVRMGNDVTEALKEILSTQGQMSFDDAKNYLAKLAADGRFVQELWA
jgi:NADPH-ferrihemoprotein reductase